MQHGSAGVSYETADSWIILSDIEQNIKQKIVSVGIPLREWNVSINYGIKTGFNDAFIINTETKDALIAEDPRSAEIIRPILRGRDIRRYGFTFANLYVIVAQFGSYEYMEAEYPAIYRHLCQYKEALQKRGQCRYTSSGKRNTDRPYPGQHHWLELDNNPRQEYLDDLAKQKIIWGEISDKPKFAIDIQGDYCPEATTFLMTGEHLKYLLCFLNSTFSEYFFAKYGTTTGMGTLRWKKYLIELLPIPRPDCVVEETFNAALDALLAATAEDCIASSIQRINSLVYSTIGLTDQEIETVEKIVAEGAH